MNSAIHDANNVIASDSGGDNHQKIRTNVAATNERKRQEVTRNGVTKTKLKERGADAIQKLTILS